MKRKIAAIFAADIAGYSRLIAEDEEETLRRLGSYRQVTDDFIAKCGGRIFNTAGDAVLAEFPSAVEAVRCAIDIQESLRTRNMAYPPSRQMAFRIGITIGDVVERDGDLLGDGVNIAARLEGLAEVGGICVSRAVHEQVANKLSVQFADIGEQEVKNIPNPVHAYMVAMRREDGTYAKPQVKKPAKPQAAPNWMWPVAVTVVCLAAIGVAGFLYFTKLEMTPAAKGPSIAGIATEAAPAPQPSPALTVAAPPSPPTVTPPPPGKSVAMTPPAPQPPATPPVKAAAVPPPPSLPSLTSGEKFAPETMPFVSMATRTKLASEYVPAADAKAIATTINGIYASVMGQPSEDAAKAAALEQCQKKADAANVAAQMRDLRCRQHRGLFARQAADAAAAMDPARRDGGAAVRHRRDANGARPAKDAARERLFARSQDQGDRARARRAVLLLDQCRIGRRSSTAQS